MNRAELYMYKLRPDLFNIKLNFESGFFETSMNQIEFNRTLSSFGGKVKINFGCIHILIMYLYLYYNLSQRIYIYCRFHQ